MSVTLLFIKKPISLKFANISNFSSNSTNSNITINTRFYSKRVVYTIYIISIALKDFYNSYK